MTSYNINVSKGGAHFFAARVRGEHDLPAASKVYRELLAAFPERDGYRINVSDEPGTGRDLTERMTGFVREEDELAREQARAARLREKEEADARTATDPAFTREQALLALDMLDAAARGASAYYKTAVLHARRRGEVVPTPDGCLIPGARIRLRLNSAGSRKYFYADGNYGRHCSREDALNYLQRHAYHDFLVRL